ncbi:hypothetical protein CXG81DRAFT_17004 [Caulochytrium protostelioides]|uniref:Uncharacterized protein n=1 Tax=Caulochytrium protostelioides TaxID=1555241 RepID=A0A4P9XEC0_9FUNG|nr:hypothetical protein CXG81DRAFT_17004 [Caulochytrium protostelioides]|eukprot:RKP03500.1 hypothetical protein CXG81DRAFT_17004 [Caulochytrium protostelioides]
MFSARNTARGALTVVLAITIAPSSVLAGNDAYQQPGSGGYGSPSIQVMPTMQPSPDTYGSPSYQNSPVYDQTYQDTSYGTPVDVLPMLNQAPKYDTYSPRVQDTYGQGMQNTYVQPMQNTYVQPTYTQDTYAQPDTYSQPVMQDTYSQPVMQDTSYGTPVDVMPMLNQAPTYDTYGGGSGGGPQGSSYQEEDCDDDYGGVPSGYEEDCDDSDDYATMPAQATGFPGEGGFGDNPISYAGDNMLATDPNLTISAAKSSKPAHSGLPIIALSAAVAAFVTFL